MNYGFHVKCPYCLLPIHSGGANKSFLWVKTLKKCGKLWFFGASCNNFSESNFGHPWLVGKHKV